MSHSLYWAGDRGFRSCTRWHDEETIRILTRRYHWQVNYPFDSSIEVDESRCSGFFGKRGVLRERCLAGIRNSEIVVAYLGTFDTGTAQEIEYALMEKKPILGWNDSAIVVGEHAGRELTASQKDLEKLHVSIMPMNGMTTVIDRYVEFSRLGGKTGPEDLAAVIHREASQLTSP